MRVLLDTQAFIYAIDENQHHKLPGRRAACYWTPRTLANSARAQ
jgi:hypothetical protein